MEDRALRRATPRVVVAPREAAAEHDAGGLRQDLDVPAEIPARELEDRGLSRAGPAGDDDATRERRERGRNVRHRGGRCRRRAAGEGGLRATGYGLRATGYGRARNETHGLRGAAPLAVQRDPSVAIRGDAGAWRLAACLHGGRCRASRENALEAKHASHAAIEDALKAFKAFAAAL